MAAIVDGMGCAVCIEEAPTFNMEKGRWVHRHPTTGAILFCENMAWDDLTPVGQPQEGNEQEPQREGEAE